MDATILGSLKDKGQFGKRYTPYTQPIHTKTPIHTPIHNPYTPYTHTIFKCPPPSSSSSFYSRLFGQMGFGIGSWLLGPLLSTNIRCHTVT